MRYRLLFCFASVLLWGCQPANKPKNEQRKMPAQLTAFLEKAIALDSIPSGSGLAKVNHQLYLISDDSPYFFQLDLQSKLQQKIGIKKGEKSKVYRIPKKIKSDYESLATAQINGKPYLLAFGSGSLSPGRDSLLIINLADLTNSQTYALTAFYQLLKEAANLPDAELNIEGSAIIGEDLFLFNRGQNVVVQTNWGRLLLFLKGGPNIIEPKLHAYRIKLPEIQGISPGFSGACQLGNENKLLFTASVENTKSWVEDGDILGSFVGILNVEKLASEPLEGAALLTDKNGRPVIEKVESIEFLERTTNGKIKALALTDDDKGGSKILEITLEEISK